ncbi:MAG: ribonuclease M5 [Clostridia bacterium]|nr:ribonuclease M5 [Clostridia bacterium]
MIKEIIVVEGKDDIRAVKRAVEAEVIITNGFALSRDTVKVIRSARDRQGVIILTDPDFAGEQLRKRINKLVPGCKHAFMPRDEATLHQDVGVENASPEAIRIALKKARCEEQKPRQVFSQGQLWQYGLLGSDNSQKKRAALGKVLGIGYANGKQLINRLNNFGVTWEEFLQAIEIIEGD